MLFRPRMPTSRTTMSIENLASGLFFLFLLMSGTANSVEINFTAKIDQHYSQGGTNQFLDSLIPIGSTLKGKLTYDIDAPVRWVNTTDSGSEYQYTGGSLALSVGSFSASAPSHSVGVIDGAYMGWDQFVIWTNSPDNGLNSSAAPFPLMAAGFGLYDPTGAVFKDNSLPERGLDLNEFSENMFTLIFENMDDPDRFSDPEMYSAYGRIESFSFGSASPIPEPSSVILIILSLTILSFLGRRQSSFMT